MKKINAYKQIVTIGHSTHTIEEFIAILEQYQIQLLIDVRSIPRSRHVPQFNSEALSKSLAPHHIAYEHMEQLGGLRPAKKDSINQGWRNQAFRGFADYMQTEEFENALVELIEKAMQKTVAIMCAEAVPWRCHRSLISDALLLHGFQVKEIISKTSVREHKLTAWAHVEGLKVTYPSS